MAGSMNMKTLGIIGVGAVAIIAGAAVASKIFPAGGIGDKFAQVRPAAGDAEADENLVVAIVDGEEITRGEVFEFIETLPPQMRQLSKEALFPLALDQVINSKITADKAAHSGIENEPETQEKFEEAKRRIVQALFLQKQLDAAVTDEKIEEAYQAHLQAIGDEQERKASHILVETEDKAKEIIAKLGKGEDFAVLAQEHSTGPTGENGGSLGWFTKGQMVAEFSEAAYEMDKGSVSAAPVKTQFGWHVIKLEDVRQKPKPAKEEMVQFLENQIRRETMEGLIADWRAESTIQRFDIHGHPIDTPANAGAPAVGAGAPADAAPAGETPEGH